jgi:hypothetical protein
MTCASPDTDCVSQNYPWSSVKEIQRGPWATPYCVWQWSDESTVYGSLPRVNETPVRAILNGQRLVGLYLIKPIDILGKQAPEKWAG